MKQKARVDSLFDKWDNEGSGYLEIEEIETITHKYKDGLERQAINRGKNVLQIQYFPYMMEILTKFNLVVA